MKKIGVWIITFLLLLSATGCAFFKTGQDEVLDSVGKYKSKQFWTSGGFQDYTDFGIYAYSSVNLENHPYFSRVSKKDEETIEGFLDNFENWIRIHRENEPENEISMYYDFDRAVIDSEDYFYIYEGENYQKYGCYDLWIYDTQSDLLYYFHNNI